MVVILPISARVIRSSVLSIKKRPFSEAAKNLGYSHGRILFVHLLPNCLVPLHHPRHRWPGRRLMMASQVFGMVLAVMVPVMVALGQRQVWLILAIAAGRGAMVAFNQPARHSLVPEVVPKHILPSAIALPSLTFNLTKIIGPCGPASSSPSGARRPVSRPTRSASSRC